MNIQPPLSNNFHQTQQLIEAVVKGNVEVVQSLLDAHADINSLNKPLDKPILSIAAEKGQRLIVDLLLARQADVKAEDYLGRTPLFVAKSSENENEDCLMPLLKAGSDRNHIAARAQKMTVFQYKVYELDYIGIRILLNTPLKPLTHEERQTLGEAPLLKCLHKDVVSIVVSYCDERLRKIVNRANLEYELPLSRILKYVSSKCSDYENQKKAIVALLDAGADPDIRPFNQIFSIKEYAERYMNHLPAEILKLLNEASERLKKEEATL